MIASTLYVYRTAAYGSGPDGFAEYAVARRILALLVPISAVGLDVALARSIAIADDGQTRERRSLLAGALAIAGSMVALLALVLAAAPGPAASLFFGSSALAPLAGTLPVLLAGATLHVVAYADLRGRRRIGLANALTLADHALVPPVAFAVAAPSIVSVLWLIGAGWLAISAAAILSSGLAADRIGPRAARLAREGAVRVPGDVAQLLLFALPVVIAAHVGSLAEAGAIAFGLTALGMVGSALTPLGVVLFPTAARALRAGAASDIRRHVGRLLGVVVPLLIAVTALVVALGDRLVAAYLGPELASADRLLRALILAALPWGLFVALRNIIDARDARPVNARNLGAALVIFAGGSLALVPPFGVGGIAVAFVAAIFALGALTVLEVGRMFRVRPYPVRPGTTSAA